LNRAFCTLFDSNYLTRGLVMLRSLKRWHPSAAAFVLCLDDDTKRLLSLLALPDVQLISLPEVEDDRLLRVKGRRTTAEYCWTLASFLCAWLMEDQPEITEIVYLDADLMFFSELSPVLEESAGASITILEHRFQPWNQYMGESGRFNVSWVGFRRDPEGMACLTKWRDQCLEWCYARLEDGKMGDQKYLDAWPDDYRSVHILQHKGAGVAPWNFSNHPITESAGRVLIGDAPLVFYHFHQFHWLSDGSFDRMLSKYANGRTPPPEIYEPYEQALHSALAEVRAIERAFNKGMARTGTARMRRLAQRWLPFAVRNWLKALGRLGPYGRKGWTNSANATGQKGS
jgi:hypothetical protein